MAVALVVVPDAGDRLHAGVVLRGGGFFATVGEVPVEDAPDERRDEEHPGVGAGHRLGEGEQQGQVGLDALAFQNLGGADSFPGGGDLDQQAVGADAGIGVQLHQPPRLGDGGLGIEAQPRVDLGGDAAGDEPEDFAADRHREAVAGIAEVAVRRGHRRLHVRGVGGQRRRLQQQRGIGGRILRLEAGDGIDVAGVGDDHGVAAELFEGVGQGGGSSGVAGIVAQMRGANAGPQYSSAGSTSSDQRTLRASGSACSRGAAAASACCSRARAGADSSNCMRW